LTHQIAGKRRQSGVLALGKPILDRDVATLDVARFFQAAAKRVLESCLRVGRATAEVADDRLISLLHARRERPRDSPAAERGQQLPPSDGDCHTPLPCEVRKGNDTTPRACCP